MHSNPHLGLDMTKKTALITGATGFIGGAIARRLSELGWGVHTLVRQSSNLDQVLGADTWTGAHVHDGTTESMLSILNEVRPDIIFHLASLFISEHSAGDVSKLIESNLLFATQLAEAATPAGVKGFINTGTAWQYYQGSTYCPVNLYAATKQAFEDILSWYHDARGLSCVTLKLFDTYGPGDRRRKLINILVDASKNGTVLNMSPGEQILDLCHIDDVVSAYVRAADMLLEQSEPMFQDYMISGERLRLRDLVALVERVAGRALLVDFGGRPYRAREVMQPWNDSTKSLPSWRPSIGLEQGVRQLLSI
ncbi:MAG: NAD(P)-dependent oxidoreductase [Pandoraea sp.]|nr:MAG: NAD(P)-dependent oxidoreductase [Pandoraea sp.]